MNDMRRSDIEAVARALDPDAMELRADQWMPADLPRIKERRRKARADARTAIRTLHALGWRDSVRW